MIDYQLIPVSKHVRKIYTEDIVNKVPSSFPITIYFED